MITDCFRFFLILYQDIFTLFYLLLFILSRNKRKNQNSAKLYIYFYFKKKKINFNLIKKLFYKRRHLKFFFYLFNIFKVKIENRICQRTIITVLFLYLSKQPRFIIRVIFCVILFAALKNLGFKSK